MDDHSDGFGASYDSRCWVRPSRVLGSHSEIWLTRNKLLLLWPCAPQVGIIFNMALRHGYRGYHIPVVFLGLFFDFFAYCQFIHRRSVELRLQRCTCTAFSGLCQSPRSSVCSLPGHVLGHHGGPCYGCRRRTRTDASVYHLHVDLVNAHIRSHRLLDLESGWVVEQAGRS